jgi:hypothetical protein
MKRLGPEGRRVRSPGGSWGVVVAAALAVAAPSAALDQPISGRFFKLTYGEFNITQFVFGSDDPAVPFPAIGGSDDPASGTPGGISVEIFTRFASDLASAPAGLGNPGWGVSRNGADTYRYRNRGGAGISKLRMVTLREGRVLRIRGETVFGLGGIGPVAIRVTTASLRSCAVFDGASVRRDVINRYVARDASAPAIADCDDVTLLTALGLGCADSAPGTCGGVCPGDGVCAPDVLGGPCRCVFPTQPCGETAPVCGGECAAGEQCYPIDDFIPGSINECACAPIGEPPCGATGFACSATPCPGGLVCDLIPGFGIYDSQCSCVDPNAVCGQPGYGECPPDFECVFFPGPGGSWGCVPVFCGGTYPACGGSCASGSNCVPLEIPGGAFCVCATPGLSCDDGAVCDGGLNCPPGEVCTLGGSPLGSSCSCEPP